MLWRRLFLLLFRGFQPSLRGAGATTVFGQFPLVCPPRMLRKFPFPHVRVHPMTAGRFGRRSHVQANRRYHRSACCSAGACVCEAQGSPTSLLTQDMPSCVSSMSLRSAQARSSARARCRSDVSRHVVLAAGHTDWQGQRQGFGPPLRNIAIIACLLAPSSCRHFCNTPPTPCWLSPTAESAL